MDHNWDWFKYRISVENPNLDGFPRLNFRDLPKWSPCIMEPGVFSNYATVKSNPKTKPSLKSNPKTKPPIKEKVDLITSFTI